MIEEKPHYLTFFGGFQGCIEYEGIVYDIYSTGYLQFKDWTSYKKKGFALKIESNPIPRDATTLVLWTILKMRDLI